MTDRVDALLDELSRERGLRLAAEARLRSVYEHAWALLAELPLERLGPKVRYHGEELGKLLPPEVAEERP